MPTNSPTAHFFHAPFRAIPLPPGLPPSPLSKRSYTGERGDEDLKKPVRRDMGFEERRFGARLGKCAELCDGAGDGARDGTGDAEGVKESEGSVGLR